MTKEQKEKYNAFLNEVSEILGLNKPVDVLKLCAVVDEYIAPFQKHISELKRIVNISVIIWICKLKRHLSCKMKTQN